MNSNSREQILVRMHNRCYTCPSIIISTIGNMLLISWIRNILEKGIGRNRQQIGVVIRYAKEETKCLSFEANFI